MAEAATWCGPETGHLDAVQAHCGGGPGCPAGSERCHLAILCRRCDRQWTNPCDEHVEAA